MQSCLLRLLAASAFVALATAQCGKPQNDHANCAHWVRSGFCTRADLTSNQKAQFCGNACGICCKDADPKCAKYQTGRFCQNRFFTPVQKATFCAKTCNLCNVVVPATTTTTKAPVVSPIPCSVTLDDEPATSVNMTRGTTFEPIALNNKKAKSVKVPAKCSIALAKFSATDIYEVIGVDGLVTAKTTGEAAALFGRCACDKDRKCAVTIDVASAAPRVIELDRIGKAMDLKLAGKTIDRAYVPEDCVLTLTDDADGKAPLDQKTAATIPTPNNAKAFANCKCT